MTRPGTAAAGRRAALGVVVLGAIALAGCGSTPAAGPAPATTGAVRPPLVASLTVPGGPSWAVVEMGGSRAEHNNFWQLVTRSDAAAKWTLATPPGVADNGGLVATSLGGPALVAGFNPSQDLKFSPLATTRDGGARWTPGLLPAGLAGLPSALAAGPGGKLIALTSSGEAELSAPGGTGWTRLASRTSLAATPAGRSCGLTGLTAAGFTPSGVPLLAGPCTHSGVAGIFAAAGGSWHLAGPTMPAGLAGRRVTVLRLTGSGRSTTALLTAAAPDGAASLTAAWASPSGRWTLSPPLPLGGARIVATTAGTATAEPGKVAPTIASAGLTSAAGIILSTGRAEYIVPGGTWQRLPGLPAHAAALVLDPGRPISVLAASGNILTSWRLTARANIWTRTQTMKVPVPYGSSG